MGSVKQMLLTNWHLMRWVRLIIGLIAGIYALRLHDGMLGILSLFLLFQALTNTGCCTANGCSLPGNKRTDNL